MKKYTLIALLLFFDLIALVIIFYFLFHSFVASSYFFVMIIALLFYEKIYTLQFDFWQETKKIINAVFLAYILAITFLALSPIKLTYSLYSITIYFVSVAFILPISKRLVKLFLYKFQFLKKRVLIVGSEKQRQILQKEIQDNWYLGMVLDDKKYDTVIITSQDLSLNTINNKITKYLESSSTVYIVPYVTDINFANSNIMEYSNIRYSTILVENRLLILRNIWIKYLFDVVATLIIVPFFVLLHIVISIIIRLDSQGSIFFKQQRLGKNNKKFLCYKYRTMFENSDEILNRYLKKNPDEIVYYERYHKYKNDPRITKIGTFLRTTSIDELPQVLNVLKGEMSLVGPRPYMLNESKKLAEKKSFILKVKPGITGLWQVSGRNELTFKERNNLDIWYIKNWSLWTDFIIIIKTFKVVLSKIGAK